MTVECVFVFPRCIVIKAVAYFFDITVYLGMFRPVLYVWLTCALVNTSYALVTSKSQWCQKQELTWSHTLGNIFYYRFDWKQFVFDNYQLLIWPLNKQPPNHNNLFFQFSHSYFCLILTFSHFFNSSLNENYSQKATSSPSLPTVVSFCPYSSLPVINPKSLSLFPHRPLSFQCG